MAHAQQAMTSSMARQSREDRAERREGREVRAKGGQQQSTGQPRAHEKKSLRDKRGRPADRKQGPEGSSSEVEAQIPNVKVARSLGRKAWEAKSEPQKPSLFDAPEPQVMNTAALATLFSPTAATPSESQVSRISGVPVAGTTSATETLKGMQAIHLLEDVGGEYSRYFPRMLRKAAVEKTPQGAGAIPYATLALARRPEVSLRKRQHALHLVAKLSVTDSAPPASLHP